jgi:hypothetical protein
MKKPEERLSDSITKIGVTKFGPKLQVWQAICQCGKRIGIYVTSGTINGGNYGQECIVK